MVSIVKLSMTGLTRFLGRPFDFSDEETGNSRQESVRWAIHCTLWLILFAVTRQHRLRAPVTLEGTLRLASFLLLTCSASFYVLLWVVELTRSWRSQVAKSVLRCCCGVSLLFGAGATFGPIVGIHASLDVAKRWIPGLLLGCVLVGAILSMLDKSKGSQADL